MSAPRPYTLVAELTYRCPLHCTYCSNPVDFAAHAEELDTETWKRVLREAEDLGVVQLNLTGGEPLVRSDLEAIVEQARALDLYTNLITSGIPLTRERLEKLRDVGLDCVQLSIQDVTPEGSEAISGLKSFDRKLEVAQWVKELDFPFTVNMVLHRTNIDHVAEAVALAERLGADRLELANSQYVGWGLVNRGALLPTIAQVESARTIARSARDRLLGKMEVLFVVPDYYTERPNACMDGWARRFMVVSPDGLLLPCHLARTLPIDFDSVRSRSLSEIWKTSKGLAEFRGEDWMPEPCKSCDRRSIDFGGCRCQAYHLTGDLRATDPACELAPGHGAIEKARAEAEAGPLIQLTHRTPNNSRALSR